MKQKIHILINDESRGLGLYYGFWNWFFLFQKDLIQEDMDINFFSSISNKFLEADHLFLNSRSFPKINDRIDTNYLSKVYRKNKNLYWFDMRDSAGTTQFEVLPYVKKYIKKQFYKDRKIYSKKLEGGRFYTDYYIKKYNIVDSENYDQELLHDQYYSKLLLGWNLGVAFFFNHINFSNFDYYLELIKFKFFKSRVYKMKLPFYQNWNDDSKKFDFLSLMNTDFYRQSVGFQRKKLRENLNDIKNNNKIINGRFRKKKYYEILKNSKVSIGAYGWGEVCYREFEAVICGTSFMTADMSNIETWPNIYHEGETYLSYDLEFENLNYKLDLLIKNIDLRKKLVKNSRLVLEDCYSKIGKNYFLEKIFEIIK